MSHTTTATQPAFSAMTHPYQSDDTILALNEQPSSGTKTSSFKGAKQPSYWSYRHQKPVTISDRRQYRQEKWANLLKPRVQHLRQKNRATPSAIIRELVRLVTKLQKNLAQCSLSLLDRIAALVSRLRRYMERGHAKALTTAFYGRVPQVAMQ